MVVKNGKIDRYLFDGGYAKATASGTTDNFAFFYQNKDHLGTVRETVTSTGAMKQRVNYYPFGGQLVDTLKAMVLSPNFQQYKYNGKEFDNMYSLNTYDYGARQHYPVLARWDRIDPLCEKYYGISPYAYCANNPVNNIDLHGDSIFYDMPIVENGEITGYTRYTYGKYGDTYGFGRNGELYQGNNATVYAIGNALNKLSSGGAYGNALVSSLAGESNIDVQISYGYNQTTYREGGECVQVSWDQEDYAGGLDVNGNVCVDPFINLGHELIHAQNYVEGTVNRTPWFSNAMGGMIPYEEHVACVRENFLRAENGIPLRKYYATYGDSHRGYSPSIIENPRCLMNMVKK
ncbi:MAG: hypothetical protein IK003_03055 [Prevotella sp.]|nr:hypothetical protein [Prevotella sp.]